MEFQEARIELLGLALRAGMGLTLTLLGGLMLNLFILAACWDSPHRLAWLALATALELGTGILILLSVKNRASAWKPFGAFLRQLRADYACWRQQP